MKQAKSISKLLGLTQEQLAMILRISRRQLSKNELGLGKLPHDARPRLAAIVDHVFGTASETPGVMHAEQNSQKQRGIAKMLKENEYQRAFTARQLAAAEQKYQAKLNALKVVAFLSSEENAEDGQRKPLLQSISSKASNSLKSNGLDLLCRLKIRLEMLELEKRLLEAESHTISGK